MDYPHRFDVIVVGAGHAGTEAALAAARSGVATLLLTQNIETLGQMSCNPAIGGIGKSHLVKEIDALGGAMAIATDRAGIQFRTLNSRKGPAVRATRAQTDRQLYKAAIRQIVEKQENLQILQQSVEDLMVAHNRIAGVVTQSGIRIRASTVVLTVGTFLGGVMHVGSERQSGGRAGDKSSDALSARLRELPFRVGRLKTGTPARIDGNSVDFSKMDRQPGDEPVPVMSFMGDASQHPTQVPCHITHTTEETHQIIRNSLDRSPLFTGVIDSVGPRYCPSIEDKVVRFADKNSHQIFVEPEGLQTTELYPNGLSTSLPFDVQWDLIRSIPGFENANITRPGYAIEYDYFDPRDLKYSLETSFIGGLFFAGQINGTTGYEEAAAQGLLAGINAALQVKNEECWCPARNEAYIGVLVDDLITLGTSEPYRMFTSRAEYRLILRQDNADRRLTEHGWRLGLVDEDRWRRFNDKCEQIDHRKAELESTWVKRGTALAGRVNSVLDKDISHEYNLADLLKRPNVKIGELLDAARLDHFDREVDEQVEIDFKYQGYVARQEREIERLEMQGKTEIPASLNFADIRGLSNEVKQKLGVVRPITVAQAGRISGVTPAALSLLLIHLKKKSSVRQSA